MDVFAGRVADSLVRAKTALEEDFEAGLAQWSKLAFRVAYSVLRQREDAEDIAQDVLTNAYARLSQLRDRDRLQAWLVRMSWRLAINKRTADARRDRREHRGTGVASAQTSEEVALSAERSVRLWDAIDHLPAKLRIVVVLASIQEHDLAEVASTLGIPEGTVKSRLFDARKRLREYLQ